MSSLADDIRDEGRYAELLERHQRVLRQLDQANAKREELVEAVYRAAKDAAVGLDLPAVPPPPKDRRKPSAEVAVAILSDWQLGKRTPTYDTEVCEQRVQRYAEKVVGLTSIQRADHPVRELRVWLLGDLIEGELIFPGQAHRIDASLYRQIVVDGPRILGNFLRSMLGSFDSVHVVGVIGNHGAIGGPVRREMHPESNGDMMLYRIVQVLLEDEPRITWDLPDIAGERSWYAIDQVGGYRCLLFHGDQIRGGFAGFPWYGLAKKVQGWATSLPESFDDVALGHFHTPTRATLNRITARCNGSIESDNTYALEQLAAAGRPTQWLLYVHPEGGRVTAEYAVTLD